MRALIDPLEPRLLLSAAFICSSGSCATGPGQSIRPVITRPNLSLTVVSPIQVDLTWTLGNDTIVNTSSSSPRAAASESIIERKAPGEDDWQIVTNVPAGTSTFTDLGLRSDSIYSYRVRPAEIDAWTNEAVARTRRYDAGLSGPFQHSSPVTGVTLNILNYGATPNNASNDDGTAIRNAISAARPGDEVYIPDGVYHIKSRDIRLKTGVSIRGQSMSGAVLSAVFTDAGTSNPNSQMFRALPGVNNLTVSDLRIEMSGGQSLQYGFYLGSGSSTASSVRRIAVRNVNIEDFEKFAVAIRNGDNILVQDCHIRNATALGGGGQGYGVMIGYDNSFNNWVTGNTIGPVIRHAVVIQYRAHHNLIENNTAIDNTLDAYDLHGEDEYSNEIRYNVARGTSGGYGIGIGNTGSTHDASGPNNWIHHNEVFNSRGGIHIILGSDRQYIEDNHFHDNSQEGIRVDNGGGADLWFLRNTVTSNGTGARIADAPRLLMIDNTITHNTGSGLILGATTTDYLIIRNDFRFNGQPVQLDSLLGVFEDNLI